MRKIARFAAVLAASCALSGNALADPYKVKDLKVDMVAATAPEATQQGRNAARMVGAQRLIERLTLPEDRMQAREPIDINVIGTRLYKNFDTQEQMKSFQVTGGIRVTGLISWTFDAKDRKS